jgi:flagellar M-ring protein FliF
MGIDDAKARVVRIAARMRNIPLPMAIGGAAIVLAVLIVSAIQLGRPDYNVLFEGLSPTEGGSVIASLQKLGIPYHVDNNGAVISVPTEEVGRARLQLGPLGEPNRNDGADWTKLEDLPMTASQDSAGAIRLRATEASLEQDIMEISGAQKVRVMLAEPPDTPFLSDQPHPKASVVVVGAAQPDAALGSAIAHVVAAAVPGLAQESVVVATKGGAILYPSSPQQSIAGQLAIQTAIETAQEEKIRSLLTPMVGAGNYRVAVSANIDFDTKTIETDAYGPNSFPTTSDTKDEQRFGLDTAEGGIPGALSNQPPGPTTAQLNPAPEPPTLPPPAPGGAPRSPAEIEAATTLALAQVPHSVTKSQQQSFAIDHQKTVAQPAGWMVRDLSVAVVINQSVLPGTIDLRTVQAMLAASIAAPVDKIQVSTMQFVAPNSPVVLSVQQPILAVLLRVGLIILAAIAGIFGVIRPLLAWMKRLPANILVPTIGVAAGPAMGPDVEARIARDQEANVAMGAAVQKANELAQTVPAAIARVLQHWLDRADA